MANQSRTRRIADTEHVTMFGGSGRQDLDTGRSFTIWVNKVRNFMTHWSNGAYTQKISGASIEKVHTDPESVKEEMVGKLIHAANGDIVLIAEGNFKVKAKNILLEASDISPGGNVDIIGNGFVTIKTDEEIRIHGGNTIIAGENKLVLDGNGFLYLIGDVKNSGHPSVIGSIKNLVSGNWMQTLTDVATAIRTGSGSLL
jgi:hypothetical protein